MRVTCKLAKVEGMRHDSYVRHAAKRRRITKVARIRGPINGYSNTLATALEAECAIHLMWPQDKTKMTPSSKPLKECQLGCESMSLKPTGAI
jgi:hypothetical protein